LKIYATSDHHFLHRNIIKYAERPFNFDDANCVANNTKLMVERYNEVVQDDDIVLMVGDLSAGLKDRQKLLKEILLTLKGRKILIRGNHDYEPDSFYFSAGFIDVVPFIDIGEYFICHYPCYESQWTSKKERAMMKNMDKAKHKTIIHGHIHNIDPSTWPSDGIHRINMSVDFATNNYYPQEITFPAVSDYLARYAKKD